MVLPLKPLLPLEQLRLVRFQAREVVLFGFRPRLMQVWDHTRLVEHVLEGVPAQRIKPIRPHELGVALGRPAHAQRRVPLQIALPLTVVKLTCNENGGPTYSSWPASIYSQEDYHGPHHDILP